MTHIANYQTKKAFREAVAADPSRVHLYDPSMFNPVSGPVDAVVRQCNAVTVTNHPKRSWFARVVMSPKGIKVE